MLRTEGNPLRHYPGGSILAAPASRRGSPGSCGGRNTRVREGVDDRALLQSADYATSHVELAYASTAHGAQGETVSTAHVLIGEHTGAAAAYVGMTRGREANTAHLVADDLSSAREQWIPVFGRDRADLGPAHAAELAAGEVARYAPARLLDAFLAELYAAWTTEQRCRDRLAVQEPMWTALQELIALQPDSADRLAALTGIYQQAASAAEEAKQRVETSDAAVAAEADRFREALLRRWDSERAAASTAVRVVLAGPGWLGLRRGAVARASEQLPDWADRWRPHVPELPADPAQLAQVVGWFDDRPALWAALDASARRAADRAHPERDGLHAAADAARQACEEARCAVTEARRQADERLARFGSLKGTSDPEATLADVDHDIAATRRSWPPRGRASPTSPPSTPTSLSRPTGWPRSARPGASATTANAPPAGRQPPRHPLRDRRAACVHRSRSSTGCGPPAGAGEKPKRPQMLAVGCHQWP